MDKETREKLEAAGFRVGNAEDFLELTEEERLLVDLKVAVCRAIRKARKEHHLSQQQLATKMRSSQSRVAKIEAGASDVTLDLSFKALFAAGGNIDPNALFATRKITSPKDVGRKKVRSTSHRRRNTAVHAEVIEHTPSVAEATVEVS